MTPPNCSQRVLHKVDYFFPGEFVGAHDAVAPEQHANHQQDGEHYHAQARTEQGDGDSHQLQRFVKDAQVFQSRSNDDGAEHAAGNGAHAPQHDDQQEIVG